MSKTLWEGGIYFIGSTFSVSDSLFESNSAVVTSGAPSGLDIGGGAIRSSRSSIAMDGCRFEENSATSSSSSRTGGGAVFGENSAYQMNNVEFLLNRADDGGIVRYYISGVFPSSITQPSEVTGCRFEGNVATYDGGGMLIAVTSGTSRASLGVYATDFVDNRASRGAAIAANADTAISSVTFSDLLITGNAAYTNGGGIATTRYGNISILSSTIVGSSALSGGEILGSGVYFFSGGDVDVPIRDSIVWGNTGANTSNDASYVDVAYCDIEGGPVTDGNIDEDPMFENAPRSATVTTEVGTTDSVIVAHLSGVVLNGFIIEIGNDGVARIVTSVDADTIGFDPPLAETSAVGLRVVNWGPSSLSLQTDYRLMPSSPCEDSGEDLYVVTELDLDGNARITGARVDMGAFELAP